MTTKLYPSSFSIPQGDTTFANYYSNCLRYQVFRNTLPKSDIPLGYKAIGELGELAVSHRFPKGANIKREESFKYQLQGDFILSGRVDFLETLEDGTVIVHEVKSTSSRAQLTNCINKGIVQEAHLGQLVTYLNAYNTHLGYLHVNYFHFTRDLNIGIVPRTFEIELKNNAVYIDGQIHDLSVSDILGYWDLLQQAHEGDELPPAPVSKFNVCKNCPFYQVCVESPKDKIEFNRLIDCKEEGELEPKPAHPFKLNLHNVRRS